MFGVMAIAWQKGATVNRWKQMARAMWQRVFGSGGIVATGIAIIRKRYDPWKNMYAAGNPTRILRRSRGWESAAAPTEEMNRSMPANGANAFSQAQPPLVLFDGKRHPVRLVGPRYLGKHGNVYDVEGNRLLVAKVLFAGEIQRRSCLRAKIGDLAAMRTRVSPNFPLMLPMAPLFDESGAWRGFLMQKVIGRNLQDIAHDPAVPLATKVRTGQAVCTALEQVHSQASGIVLADMCLSHALWIERIEAVLFVGADSVQYSVELPGGRIGRYLCRGQRVPTPEAREGQTLSTASDRYQLAVVLFELFFADRGLDAGKRHMESACDAPGERTHLSGICGISWHELETTVGAPAARLFKRAFCGKNERLPTPREWLEALAAIGNGG